MTKPAASISGPSRLTGRRHQAISPLTRYGTVTQLTTSTPTAGWTRRPLVAARALNPVTTTKPASPVSQRARTVGREGGGRVAEVPSASGASSGLDTSVPPRGIGGQPLPLRVTVPFRRPERTDQKPEP